MIYIKHCSLILLHFDAIFGVLWTRANNLRFRNTLKCLVIPCFETFNYYPPKNGFWGIPINGFSVGIRSWLHSMLRYALGMIPAWHGRARHDTLIKSIKILYFVMCWVNTKITILSKLKFYVSKKMKVNLTQKQFAPLVVTFWAVLS